MADQNQLNRIEAMLRVLMEAQSPQISFAEIHRRLGHGSKTTTLRWVRDHGLKKVGPRQYSFCDFVREATKAA
jgi:hypothetical protein